MRAKVDCRPRARERPASGGELVSIFVPDDHPLLQLKRGLDWAAITAVMNKHWQAAGKNVTGGRGLPWPVSLYVPLLVLMWVRSCHGRQMEQYVSESVVARRFLDLTAQPVMHERDHASIARAEAALAAEGHAAVNALIVRAAQKLGFAQSEILSSDTTVQEPLIGHPHEPGILKGWAERIERALNKLRGRGGKRASEGIAQANESYRRVKEHHLFAKTKAAKQTLLQQLVQQSETLLQTTQEVIQQVSARCLPVGQTGLPVACLRRQGRQGRPVNQSAAATLKRLVEVAHQLLPQIKYWMQTGHVAAQKIVHAGITEARAIVKRQGRVKFGMKWLIHRLRGGYLFGRRVDARASENQMPAESVKDYRAVFGPEATPAMVVYDRGACLPTGRPVCRPRPRSGTPREWRRSGSPREDRAPGWWGRKISTSSKANAARPACRTDRPKAASAGSRATNTDSLIARSGVWRRRPRPGSGPVCRQAGDPVGQFEYADARFGRTSRRRKAGARLKDNRGDEREKRNQKRLSPVVYSQANSATRSI